VGVRAHIGLKTYFELQAGLVQKLVMFGARVFA